MTTRPHGSGGDRPSRLPRREPLALWDHDVLRVARGVLARLEDREARHTLTADVFVPPPDEPGLGELEAALERAVGALPIETKLRDAVRAGAIDRAPGFMLDELGLAAGVITKAEYDALNEARAARDEVVAVDAFTPEVYKTLH